ncbi:radical SAM protein, partial [Patescibacteria group bacterium]|nr:radical SAM protein [Patescibacteria group bacterium]
MGSKCTKRSPPILRHETSGFILSYGYSRSHGQNALKLKSRAAGQHFAVHTRFNLLAEDGSIIDSQPITEQVARFIMDNFEGRGDTASFDVYETDLKANRVLPRAKSTVTPDDVRHKLTTTEHSYTATGTKLLHHWPIFKKFGDTGYGSIIRATMTLHQVCSSRCQYCSTIARNRADSISLEEAMDFVRKLYQQQAQFNQETFPEHNRLYKEVTGSDIRLKGLILSGGGQPNLWPHFKDFVCWLSFLDIDLGLITNGFPARVPDEVYGQFKWVRISITPEDASPHYKDGQFNKQLIPASLKNNPQLTVGYSYVYGPWTDDDILRRISDSMEENGFTYCRMLTDCNLTRAAQLRAHQALSERLHRLGFISDDGTPVGRFFHQLKYHGTAEEAVELWDQGQCFLQTYNVFWDTTGHEENGRS